jgi:hypothetical protein
MEDNMEQVYNAELINNQINWIGVKPKSLTKNRKYKVRVILEQEMGKARTGRELVEAFRNSPLFGIELDLTRDKDPGRIIDL